MQKRRRPTCILLASACVLLWLSFRSRIALSHPSNVIKQTGMLALFAVPTLGLQARPALLAPCSAIHRCAPPRALHYDGNENRIDHDDVTRETSA